MVRSRPAKSLRLDLAELAGLLVLLAEALHHPDAGDRAVDDAGDRGGLPLGVPGGGEEPGAAALGDEPESGGDGERDQGQQRGQPRHDHRARSGRAARCR